MGRNVLPYSKAVCQYSVLGTQLKWYQQLEFRLLLMPV